MKLELRDSNTSVINYVLRIFEWFYASGRTSNIVERLKVQTLNQTIKDNKLDYNWYSIKYLLKFYLERQITHKVIEILRNTGIYEYVFITLSLFIRFSIIIV